ncbi:MAG: arsenic resistance N-acetyltransferase ArsN2 [Desulfobacterales bacterium]|jgi:amino-acid N-acetyltransferase
MDFSFATAKDGDPVKQILNASGLEHRDISASQLQHFIKAKDTNASALSGVVGLELKGNVGLLRSLAVAEAYRRQRLATQLVSKIEEYARSKNIDTLYLLTLTAEDFFSARGYQKTDRESAPPALQETTEFKSLCPQTAVCMIKHL